MEQKLKERPDPADLESLEKRLQNIQERLDRFAKLLKGNGDTGLLGQVFQNSERIANLQAQWKWLVAVLAALVAAVAQGFLRGEG